MSRLTRNLQEGESLSFDGGRIKFTMLRRSGRMARIQVDVADDVRVDKPTPEQIAEAKAREVPYAGGYV